MELRRFGSWRKIELRRFGSWTKMELRRFGFGTVFDVFLYSVLERKWFPTVVGQCVSHHKGQDSAKISLSEKIALRRFGSGLFNFSMHEKNCWCMKNASPHTHHEYRALWFGDENFDMKFLIFESSMPHQNQSQSEETVIGFGLSDTGWLRIGYQQLHGTASIFFCRAVLSFWKLLDHARTVPMKFSNCLKCCKFSHAWKRDCSSRHENRERRKNREDHRN